MQNTLVYKMSDKFNPRIGAVIITKGTLINWHQRIADFKWQNWNTKYFSLNLPDCLRIQWIQVISWFWRARGRSWGWTSRPPVWRRSRNRPCNSFRWRPSSDGWERSSIPWEATESILVILKSGFLIGSRSSPVRLVARPDFQAGLDEGHQGLVLEEGQGRLEQEALGVAELGVEFQLGESVIVRPPDHAAQGLGESCLPAELVNRITWMT